MDRWRMDAESCRVVHRERRSRKLAAVVAVQNVLVVACLLATLYVYWDVRQEQSSEDNIHIEFGSISDVEPGSNLTFDYVASSHRLSLVNGMIGFPCTGPYVVFMSVCYVSRGSVGSNGVVQVEVKGKKNPVTNFTLTTSHEDCRGLHSIVYFAANELARLKLHGDDSFKIKNATLTLSYLLGTKCHG